MNSIVLSETVTLLHWDYQQTSQLAAEEIIPAPLHSSPLTPSGVGILPRLFSVGTALLPYTPCLYTVHVKRFKCISIQTKGGGVTTQILMCFYFFFWPVLYSHTDDIQTRRQGVCVCE